MVAERVSGGEGASRLLTKKGGVAGTCVSAVVKAHSDGGMLPIYLHCLTCKLVEVGRLAGECCRGREVEDCTIHCRRLAMFESHSRSGQAYAPQPTAEMVRIH